VGVPQAPAITSQPANQTVMAGTNVAFTVTASGFAPLAYPVVFQRRRAQRSDGDEPQL
jgi:hypothetical protein